MKHYPVLAGGLKASACVVAHWRTATVSVKVSHRMGQSVIFETKETKSLNGSKVYVWTDDYPTYTAIRFEIPTAPFQNERIAALWAAAQITKVIKSINFEASQDFVSKELLIVLG